MADTFDSTDALVCIGVDCIAVTLFVIGIFVFWYNMRRDSSVDKGDIYFMILPLSFILTTFSVFLGMDISWYKWYRHQYDGDFEDSLAISS